MIIFEEMLPEHWPEVSSIYEQGIKTGNATFEKNIPSWETWNAGHLKISRIVALENGKVVGWAALSPVSGRCAYGGVAEISVYVDPENQGKGIGKQLLEKLIEDSETNKIWTLQAGIFPENKPSLKIHDACGFRVVGVREKIGKMDDVWRDTVLLERRSSIVGL